MMAPAIAKAASWNLTFVLPEGDDKTCEWIGWLKDIFVAFNSTIPLLKPSMMKHWKNVGQGGLTEYSPIPVSQQNFTLSGYRQTWKYFNDDVQEKALRKAFRLSAKYENFAVNNLAMAKSLFSVIQNPLIVGIHMRIGDLALPARLEYGYVMANESFYSNVMKKVKSYFNSDSIIFVVATDSVSVAKRMLSKVNTEYNIFWSGGSDFQDFATLSKCDHSIISGGTYGFWTAWLAGGETFYFENFAKPGSSFATQFTNEQFYLPRWRPVSWS